MQINLIIYAQVIYINIVPIASKIFVATRYLSRQSSRVKESRHSKLVDDINRASVENRVYSVYTFRFKKLINN